MKRIAKYLWVFIPLAIVLLMLLLQNISRLSESRERLGKLLGQFFIVGFKDLSSLTETIRSFAPGGIIFYSKNIPTEAALWQAINLIKTQYETLHLPPPFLAIDHEGGGVFRLFDTEALQPPSAESIGLSHDKVFAERVAHTSGCELRNLGFSMIIGPVIDYWTEPCSPIRRRSFSSDRVTAEEFANITARQYSKLGIKSVFKHFPNLGATRVDTHNMLFTIESPTLSPLPSIDSADPFLLISHSIFPPFNRDLPVSVAMSENDFEKIGGSGILRLTDDLSMLSNIMGVDKAAIEAWNAGVDMMLIGSKPDQIYAAISMLYDEINSGKQVNIDDSLRLRGQKLIRIREALASQTIDGDLCSNKLSNKDYLSFSRQMLRSFDDMSTLKKVLKNRRPDLAIALSETTAKLASKYVRKVSITSKSAGVYDSLLTLPKGSLAIVEITESYLEAWSSILSVLDPSITVIGLVPDSPSLPVKRPHKGALVFSSSLTSQAREAVIEGLFDEKPIETFDPTSVACQ